jgi:amino-acid N-acetyltransferase
MNARDSAHLKGKAVTDSTTIAVLRRATEADWPGIETLLTETNLPLAGAPEALPSFLVAIRGETVVGAAALERYGTVALLRSVAVRPDLRGTGLGQELVRRQLEIAPSEGVQRVVLLTTTAAEYFPRFGFRTLPRADVPAAAQAALEFREACPDTAVAMLLDLRVN